MLISELSELLVRVLNARINSLAMETGRTEADLVRKMGSATELCDHYYILDEIQDEDHDIITTSDCCSFVGDTRCPEDDQGDDDMRGRGSAATVCPLRRRITSNDNDDVDEDTLHHFSYDSNCPRICPSSSSPCGVITSTTFPAGSSTMISCCPNNNKNMSNDIRSCNNDSFNDNCICNRRRVNKCEASRNHNNESSKNCSSSNNSSSIRSKRRISSSSSLLTRPCALYFFTVLFIIDLSDFNSGLLISSSSSSSQRTASVQSSDNNNNSVYNTVVSTMRRYNGLLVNGAFDNKNGHQIGLLGGLTASPQVPTLSMDSVFFDHSIGNQLTDSSESDEQQQGENTSEEMEDDDDDYESVTISRTVEPQQLKRLESKFLNLFGMAKRSQRPKDSKKQIKIPKYLLDLYQKQTGIEFPTSNLNLPGRHTRTANTVRTFYQQPGNPKEPSSSWEGRENHIQFNLDAIPSMETVNGAELRVPFTITVDHANPSSSAFVVKSGGNNRESISDSGNGRSGSSSGDSVGGQGQVVQDEHQQQQQLRAVRILVHDIVKPASSPESAKPEETRLLEPITYPIDSKHVVLSKRRNGTSSFWLTFDVFPAVNRWMSNPEWNHGLVLEIVGVTNEGHFVPHETVVQKHNLRVRRDIDDHDTTEPSVSAGVVGGSSLGNNIITTTESSTKTTATTSANGSSSKSTQVSAESLSSSVPETPSTTSSVVVSSSTSPTEVGVATDDGFIKSNERQKKNLSRNKPPVNSVVLFTYSDDGHNPAKTRDANTLSRHYRSAQVQRRRKNQRNKNRKRNLCQRHAMFVDFQDVGWESWILAPPGYAAYYCAGECPFPMAEHLNATNHAVIQALVHSMNPALVPPPCCVPTKYSSLSLLYTDSTDKIILKNYNEMVVDSCGCS